MTNNKKAEELKAYLESMRQVIFAAGGENSREGWNFVCGFIAQLQFELEALKAENWNLSAMVLDFKEIIDGTNVDLELTDSSLSLLKKANYTVENT